MLQLQEMLHVCNPFVQFAQSCVDIAAATSTTARYNIRIVSDQPQSSTTPHPGTMNLPVADEVAVFYFGDESARSTRDMIMSDHEGHVRRVNINNC